MMANEKSHTEQGNGWVLDHNPSLSALTSLRLGGKALAHLKISQQEGLVALAQILKKTGGSLRTLGRGSNILAKDEDLELFLCTYTGKKIDLIEERDEKKILRVEAGLPLPLALAEFSRLDLTGFEGLSGIPGSLGGALKMNAGSFGHETADCLEAVEIYTQSAGLEIIARKDLNIKYRSLNIPSADKDFIIIAGVFAFTKDHNKRSKAKMLENMNTKKKNQPLDARSAGCVFKNPEGYYAGKLIEEAGLKGHKIGDMAFSDLHANFLINLGQGNSEQALTLISLAKEKVQKSTGLVMECEVEVWP